ncbi:MAG: monovalent cation/H(+) antiporter subunit G [Acidiphilium sp.]|jgi:multicomponent Na+:H+ antiporter subunit G|nr:monovalent cation/H(+) antiporter subunit G [Acidiphilium sp.]
MTKLFIDALLAVLVLCAWLGCAGFARLRTPLDQMHCVTFVNATCGTALVVIGFVADGPSNRAFMILLVAGVSLLSGAAISHAIGRALLERGSAAQAEAAAVAGRRS